MRRISKAEKAVAIAGILEELFPSVPIPLSHSNSYTLLIAVLLSAQCTDERVNKVTPELFSIADSPEKMRNLKVSEISRIIKPCGLAPAKSKAIHALSEILVNEYDSMVPASFESLEKLPGVGHKTASVVMSQAFGIPAFPVDTHIHRLAYRWALSSGKNVKQTESDLKRIFPRETWNKLHLQMIYFGRKYCPARSHVVADCPICSKYGRRSLTN